MSGGSGDDAGSGSGDMTQPPEPQLVGDPPVLTPAPPLWQLLYTFRFFHPETEALLLAHMTDARRMRVALPPGCPFSDAEVRASLERRVPCFIGGRICWDMFHPEIALSSFSESDVMEAQKMGMRYAIAGLAAVAGRAAPIVVIHTWAPNLESGSAPDYHHLVDAKGHLKLAAYRSQILDMAHCIFRAAADYAPPDGSALPLYIPLVGQGFYVAMLSEWEQTKCRQALVAAINEVAPQYPAVRAELVGVRDWPRDDYPPDAIVQYRKQDMFRLPDDGIYAVVNAWDSHSFIGNGGSQDASVDGWLVSGCGPNETLRNTSYLHNPCMSPELLQTENWLR